jgi:hypothetical protein
MPNAVTAFLDDHLAAGGGARPAITTPTGSATYRDLRHPEVADAASWARRTAPAS